MDSIEGFITPDLLVDVAAVLGIAVFGMLSFRNFRTVYEFIANVKERAERRRNY
ncbi:MAG: hypothetical protein AAB955_02820 [Patescibacteria group bacterium]